MTLLLAKMHALFLVHYCFTFSIGLGCSAALKLVVGSAGDPVTLRCKYSVETHGAVSACWGRGLVPLFKCQDTIVSTDGAKVTFRTSGRYQLRGGMEGGDVSLTIVNITQQDSGNYGCRVEIPGLFNDEKYNFHLLVRDAFTTEGTIVVPARVQTEQEGHDFTGNTIRIIAIIVISALILCIITGSKFSRRCQISRNTQEDAVPTV
ncbi:hepatitis A virus cellular receptor 1 homolog [Brienomyrus brachyistius]|uniref:hepatitis A virus cellular receptor 1 homolog n=1 Tax=Brienomyrus brachyistius TaxID=42636 RepID=UPI0020B3FD40|nr:hepatitis A virus cellular receptor 1 homolog [Brienomyrus brachyistius]